MIDKAVAIWWIKMMLKMANKLDDLQYSMVPPFRIQIWVA